MTEQTTTVTRLLRARDLIVGTVIERSRWTGNGFSDEQVVVLDIEQHDVGGETQVTGIGVDEAGEQVHLHWADWAVVRVVLPL